MRRFVFMILPAMVCLNACTEHYRPEQIEIVELGATEKVITLADNEPGCEAFKIYANCDWEWKQLSGKEWLTVDYVRRDLLQFSFVANNGYDRSARIVIFKDSRADTLQVRQRGVVSYFVMVKEHTGIIPAEGGSFSDVMVETNVPQRDVRVETDSPEQFSELYYSGHRLYFSVRPSHERDKKSYKISVYAIDGWGERVEGTLSLIQAARAE